MSDLFEFLDNFFNYDGNIDIVNKEHGRLVAYRMDSYCDVLVYEDGYEQSYYLCG